MAINTATVETLTAEVRVLMVGSRQVTMSVFNQLDTVRLDYLDDPPFGRVRPRNTTEHEIYVVGRHAYTGELVSSRVWNPKNLRRKIRANYYSNKEYVTPGESEQSQQDGVIYGGDPVRHGITWPLTISWTEAEEMYRRFSELPLIVLAGLR